MAARAKITMSPEEYLAGLKKLEADTTKSASKMENSFKQYGTSINKAGIAMRYVSSEMGAGAVAFGRAFQVLAGGKIAIAVASVAAAFTALKKIWDELTVSSDEYKSKLDSQIKSNDKNIESLRKTQSEEDAMLERLKELATRENKTNEETDEQIRLAEILSGKYGKLGISVDDLTGDYSSLLGVMKRINDLQNAERASALENQINTIQSSISDSAKAGIVGNWVERMWDGFANYLGFSAKPALGGDIFDYYNSLSAQDKLGYAKSMLDPSNRFGAKTSADISFWESQSSELEKLIDLENRLNLLRETGFETEKERNAALETRSNKSREELDEIVAQAAAEFKMQQQQEEADRKHLEALAEALNKEEEIARKQQKAIDDRQKDDKMSLRLLYLRKTGQGEQAAIEEALYNETRNQGLDSYLDLGPELISGITQRAKMRYALENLQTAPTTTPELYAPRVNSLIARGGSAAPMKLPKVEEYQAKTLNSVDTIARRLGTIQNKIEDWGLT